MKRTLFITVSFSLALLALIGVWKAKVRPQPLSFSDNILFPNFCASLVQNPKDFDGFKRSPMANLAWENMSYQEGKSQLEVIETDFAELLQSLESLRENDLLGNPRRFAYKRAGVFSPTTLRYIRMAGELRRHFGSLDRFKILEIGGGYGGECKVLSTLFSFEEYTIVDLPHCLKLSQKYLSELHVPKVTYCPLQSVPSKEYDLIISDLFFGEMDRSIQKLYIDRLFAKSRAAYLLLAPAHWKEIPYSQTEHKRVKPYPKEKLLELFAQKGFICEELSEKPPTGKGHYILKLTRK